VASKPKGVIFFLLSLTLGVLAVYKFGADRAAQPQTRVERLKPEAVGRSWKVEGVLGQERAALFTQGQFCYLPPTMGPR